MYVCACMRVQVHASVCVYECVHVYVLSFACVCIHMHKQHTFPLLFLTIELCDL